MKQIPGFRGFTLIELMMSAVIFGVLSALAASNTLRLRCRAETAEARAMLGTIAKGQVAYKAENDVYLASASCAPSTVLDTSGPYTLYSKSNLSCTNMSELGFEPRGQSNYVYTTGTVPTSGDLYITAVKYLGMSGSSPMVDIWTYNQASGEITQTNDICQYY